MLPYISGGIRTSPSTFPVFIYSPGINTTKQIGEQVNSNWTSSSHKNNLYDFRFNFEVFIPGGKIKNGNVLGEVHIPPGIYGNTFKFKTLLFH